MHPTNPCGDKIVSDKTDGVLFAQGSRPGKDKIRCYRATEALPIDQMIAFGRRHRTAR